MKSFIANKLALFVALFFLGSGSAYSAIVKCNGIMFSVLDEIIESEPNTVNLIINSTDDGSKQYWFDMWPSMTEKQRQSALAIYAKEYSELSKICSKKGVDATCDRVIHNRCDVIRKSTGNDQLTNSPPRPGEDILIKITKVIFKYKDALTVTDIETDFYPGGRESVDYSVKIKDKLYKCSILDWNSYPNVKPECSLK